jgi:tRNA(Ile)-lysidine synthase
LAAKSSADFLTLLAAATANLPPRRKYLIGVSGGKDSMALLHGLVRCGFRQLVVCHLDHRLRGGVAAADAVFVARAARHLGLREITGGADVLTLAREQKISVETAARHARHDFFATCAREERCPRLLLAHHQDDQLETIMHHFFRGSGRRGLGAMRAIGTLTVGRRRLQVLRPLLGIPRLVLARWMEANHIPWREDATNLSPAHTRNRLRHELLPLLEDILGRNFREPVLRLSETLGTEDEYLEEIARQVVPTQRSFLPVAELRALPCALQRRVVLAWLREKKIPDAGFQEVGQVLRLLAEQEPPARVNLPGGRHARRTSGKIYLTPLSSP